METAIRYDEHGLLVGRIAFTQKETADIFGVHRKTVKRWWDDGVLEYIEHASKRWTPRWAIIAATAAANA